MRKVTTAAEGKRRAARERGATPLPRTRRESMGILGMMTGMKRLQAVRRRRGS